MPLPTSRISLNNVETGAIRSGLNRLVNEFATRRLSNRLAPDVADSSLKELLQPRYLADGHYEIILSLRNRLALAAGQNRNKHRFTVIEYAVLAFALRVACRFNKTQTPPGLYAKMEKYRKRAKRAAVSEIGMDAYTTAAKAWACSSRWIRFYLLPLPEKRGFFLYKPRKFYAEQFGQMLGFAQAVIADRCTESLPEVELSRLVKLISREIRRGRHPGVRVRVLINDEQRAKDFLFEVIKKKRQDLKVKFEFKSPIEQRMERWSDLSERLRSAMIIETDGKDETDAPGLQPTPPGASAPSTPEATKFEKPTLARDCEDASTKSVGSAPTTIQTMDSKRRVRQTKKKSGDRVLRFPEAAVVSRIAEFLNPNVGSPFWNGLRFFASQIVRTSTPIPRKRQIAGDLEEVFRCSQPYGGWTNGNTNQELEYMAVWLIHFLYQCGADHESSLELLRKGMKMEADRRAAVA